MDLLLTIVLDALGRFKLVAVGSAIETILMSLVIGFVAALFFGVEGMLIALPVGQVIFGTIIMGVVTLRSLNALLHCGAGAFRR